MIIDTEPEAIADKRLVLPVVVLCDQQRSGYVRGITFRGITYHAAIEETDAEDIGN